MFDSMYDADGNEWQTKAYGCDLASFRVGDALPSPEAASYQVEILGGPHDSDPIDSYATILHGVLVSINNPRNSSLPMLDYHGYMST